MNILVMGAGALGGYFGGRLAEAGHDVTFVARGAQLEALQQNGLKIQSPAGDLHLPTVKAVSDPKKGPNADVVLFLVKNFDVEAAAQTLLHSLKPDCVIVTLQNGVSAFQRLGEIVGHDRVVPGIAFIRLMSKRRTLSDIVPNYKSLYLDRVAKPTLIKSIDWLLL